MTAIALIFTGVLLLVSGFFVASEFALVGSRRHRLEQAAAEGARGARAALAGVRQLSMTLAGAQMGITMVVVGLGMVSEPAVHHLLEPLLEGVGAPEAVADAVAVAIALVVVTFLHVVIGEMAPKSWAISHPEQSAMRLAPPFRGFMWLLHWPLAALNGTTNGLLRLLRIAPRDEVAHVRNREQIHYLVDESMRLGLIRDGDHGLLSRALDAPDQPVGSVMIAAADIVEVPATSDPDQVTATAARSGKTRLVVRDEVGHIVGAVHVREALLTRAQPGIWTAGSAATAMPQVHEAVDLHGAAELLRVAHAQLGTVADDDGRIVGLISMDDLVTKIILSE